MTSMKRTSWALAIVLATVSTAHADRDARAKAIFDQRCASCHVLGHAEDLPRQTYTRHSDLTRVFLRRGEQQLRVWLKNPQAVRSDSLCEIQNLLPVEIDLLIGLLKQRAEQKREPPTVPQAEAKPPAPDKPAPRGGHAGVRR
jgi:hypothetical protein